jgi:hypothetical protein
MYRCDPSGVDLAFSFLTGGIATLNHRLIAWTPPASFKRRIEIGINSAAPSTAPARPADRKFSGFPFRWESAGWRANRPK